MNEQGKQNKKVNQQNMQGQTNINKQRTQKVQGQQNINMQGQQKMQGQQNINMQGQQNSQVQSNSRPIHINRPGQKNVKQSNITREQPMTHIEWLKLMLLLLIPVYNIIYCIKNKGNVDMPVYKRNFLFAYMLYYFASMGISIILSIVVRLIIR